MGQLLFKTMRGYKRGYLFKDLLSGVITAAVSIPISMGYAQIAGLPAVYGLYGSVFPILLFAVFSSSPQFIFGVDAAPAAIVGASLATLGITSGSSQALTYVPLVTLFTGLWLLLFYFLGAGKIVNFISTPVMGGFISGIALTIILMQMPKILGGTAGFGELVELVSHIVHTAHNIHWLSVGLGVGALVILRLSQKLLPKFPMAIVVMAAGALSTAVFHVDDMGVTLLAAVDPGLPKLMLPAGSTAVLGSAVGTSLTIAVVVMAETLLSENNFAFRDGYKINDNQEILACAAGTLASAFTGCCPVNGSISRTSMNRQFGGKTQAVSIVACAAMIVVLLFGTGFIGYLPVPVLTAIVISALMNVVEFHLAKRLFKVSRKEFYIFAAACLGVLLLGTIYGVIIGILLSFVSVILKASNPARAFLGVIPGREGFYELKKNRFAYAVENTVIYRFSESLFFANVGLFQSEIEESIRSDTKYVIVDAGGITDIDYTAADHLKMLYESLRRKGIQFYMTEHSERVNREMRQLGIGCLIEDGAVRRTITAALNDAGMFAPYPLAGFNDKEKKVFYNVPAEEENTMEEFSWAFGEEAVSQIEKKVRHILQSIHYLPDVQRLSENGIPWEADSWHHLGVIDEDEILRRIEMHLDELPEDLKAKRPAVMALIEKRRQHILEELSEKNPEVLQQLKESRERLEHRLEKQNPKAAEKLHQLEASFKL